ncbi:MAG: hypothetical protein WBP64_11935 [Nitrososphaeraceae archaeon]
MQIRDQFGHIWAVSAHEKCMTRIEIGKAAKEAFKNNSIIR